MNLNRVIEFMKVKVLKESWDGAECSTCGYGFGYKRGGEYAYTYPQRSNFGLQLCQTCFDKLL